MEQLNVINFNQWYVRTMVKVKKILKVKVTESERQITK